MVKQVNAFLVVAHVDEIMLKGKNRDWFFRKLTENIKKILGDGFTVSRGGGKVIITNESLVEPEAWEPFFSRIALIPGLANFSPAIRCATDLATMSDTATALVRRFRPRTFKIETTRIWKDFPLESLAVSREVGANVWRQVGDFATVEVRSPELTIKIEIDKQETLILGPKLSAVGGLPVGTAGKVLCLLSGGMDSPVAAWLMMKRGAETVWVHFENNTLRKNEVRSKIKRLAARLATLQGGGRLLIVPFGDLQQAVIAHCPAEARMLLYRRLMLRIAAELAQKEACDALVTGDSLSQVASQTLTNLRAVYASTPALKLTPLIGLNKVEIRDLAQSIGTLLISEEPHDDCCSFMVAKHPQTHIDQNYLAKLDDAEIYAAGEKKAVEETMIENFFI